MAYAEVNNSAARLVQAGNYAAALPTYLVALNVFKARVKTLVATGSDRYHELACAGYGPNSTAEARTLRRKRVSQIQRDHNFYQTAAFSTPARMAKSSYARLHMYNRVFVLSEKQENDPSSIYRRDGTSALILFNIGVTLHAQAAQTGSSRTLEKAMTTYRLAQSAVEHWALYSGGQNSLLELAILNNMALLHTQLMQIEDSVSCLRLLGQLLMQMPDLTREARSVFDWNMIIFLQGGFGETPAPAA